MFSQLLAGFWKLARGKSCLSVRAIIPSALAGNDQIATKLAHDGPQISLHPGVLKVKVKVKSHVIRALLCCHENRRHRGGLLYVLTVYPAESWAPRVRAHEFTSVCLSVCLSVG